MKELIDKFFTDNYSKLKGITKLKISYFKRNLEADIVISNSYVYLLDNIGKFTEDEIPNWCVGYICMEVNNSKSKTNYNKYNKEDKDVDVMSIFQAYENTESELIFKIDNDIFKSKLNRLDQILWNVYSNGCITKRDLADHFNIDSSSAYNYINNIKKQYKNHVSTERTI